MIGTPRGLTDPAAVGLYRQYILVLEAAPDNDDDDDDDDDEARQNQGQGQGQGQDQKWRQRSALQQQMVLALTQVLTLELVQDSASQPCLSWITMYYDVARLCFG